MSTLDIISKSEDETCVIAQNLVSEIKAPLLIGMNGNLGTGKTTFVKAFGDALFVKELITSPTFLGISEYYSGTYPLIHMDFYMKITPKAQIDKYINDRSIVLIEWIDNYKLTFNEDLKADILINIDYLDDNTRKFSIKK